MPSLGSASATATFNGTVVAEGAGRAVLLCEGNVYFAPHAVNMHLLVPSTYQSTCPAKGVASYYDVVVDGRTARHGAWVYEAPHAPFAHILGRCVMGAHLAALRR